MANRQVNLSAQARRDLVRQTEIALGMAPSSDAQIDADHGRYSPAGRRAYPFAESGGSSSMGGGSDDPGTTKGEETLIKKQWALARCLVLLAESVMLLPIRFYKGAGDDREEILEGPLRDLFDRPNPEYGWASLVAMIQMSLNTNRKGAFLILDAFDSRGYPTELWWADPNRITPVKAKKKKGEDDDGRMVSHYLMRTSMGRPEKFDRERVVWIRSATSKSDFGGNSLLDSAVGPAILAMKALKSNMLVHENAMTGAGFIHPASEEVTWTDDQADQVADLMNRTVRGSSSWHRYGIINRKEFGITEVQHLTPKDVQFHQLMEMTTKQICIATGVPLPLIQPTDATFSNAGESRGMLWSNTLIPRTVMIAEAIKLQVVDIWFQGEADVVELCTSKIPELQEDQKLRWGMDKEKLDKVLGIALQVRQREIEHSAGIAAACYYTGIPEDKALEIILPAPEEAEANDVKISAALVREYFNAALQAAQGLLPRDTVVNSIAELFGLEKDVVSAMLGGVGKDVALPAPEDEGEAGEGDERALPRTRSSGAGQRRHRPAKKGPLARPARMLVFEAGRGYRVVGEGVEAYGSENHRLHLRDVEQSVVDYKGPFQEEVAGLFQRQADEIKEALEGLSEADIDDLRSRYADDPEGLAEALISRLFNAPAWVDTSIDVLRGILDTLSQDVGTALFEEVGAEDDFDPESLGIIEELELRSTRFAVTTVDTSRQQAGARLAKGILDDGSIDDLVEGLSSLAGVWTNSRAETVALTEIHSAATKVAELAAKGSGVVESRQWVSSLDDRVRESHRDAHGQTIGVTERYSVGSTECDSPGNCDDSGEVFRCRCVERWLTRSQRWIGLHEIMTRAQRARS